MSLSVMKNIKKQTKLLYRFNTAVWIVAGETYERIKKDIITVVGVSLVTSYSNRKAYINTTSNNYGGFTISRIINPTTRIWSVAIAFGKVPNILSTVGTVFTQSTATNTVANHIVQFDSTGNSSMTIRIDESPPSGGTVLYTLSDIASLNNSVLIVTHDGSNVYIYLNSSKNSTVAHSEIFNGETPTQMCFMSRGSAGVRPLLDTEVCAVAVFERTLTQREVSQINWWDLCY